MALMTIDDPKGNLAKEKQASRDHLKQMEEHLDYLVEEGYLTDKQRNRKLRSFIKKVRVYLKEKR